MKVALQFDWLISKLNFLNTFGCKCNSNLLVCWLVSLLGCLFVCLFVYIPVRVMFMPLNPICIPM